MQSAPVHPTTTLPSPSVTLAAEARSVHKVYGSGENRVAALDDVSIGFAAGRFTAIMGPSGSGKSTLMHCLAGLDTVTSGTVMVAGQDVSAMSDKELTRLRRDHIGFIFQSFNLLPTMTALENILLPSKLARRSVDKQWLSAVIDTVGLGHRLDHRPSQLSGGQVQRVAVARALASRPSVVFADEPTGNLDSRSGAEVLSFMRRAVREMGQTIVMVTHDPVAASYADRAVFLADGRIIADLADPTPQAVLDQMALLGR